MYEPDKNKINLFYDGKGKIDNNNPLNWLNRWQKDNKNSVLKNPDQMTISADGYPLVAEDGDNNELCFLDKSGFAKPLIRLDGCLLYTSPSPRD